MTSSLGIMLLFAACVSVVFGTLLRDQTREQIRVAARIFAALVGGAIAVGWLLYLAF